MDREAWRAAVHGAEKSRMWLSDWTELKAMEVAQAPTFQPPASSCTISAWEPSRRGDAREPQPETKNLGIATDWVCEFEQAN